MTKKLLLFTLIISVYLLGCTPDITTVQVVRNPVIKFDYNSTSSWQYSNYSFSPVSKTVVYPTDTTKPGQLYNRLTLQATGKDNTGKTLQLIITFDAVDVDQLVGLYTTEYTTQRGLAQVQLFNVTDENNLAAYELCADHLDAASLFIQKQKNDERLISGSFQMQLCNQRDSTEHFDISNGVVTDITY